MKRRIIALMLALALAVLGLPALAEEAFVCGDFSYTLLPDGGAAITLWEGADEQLVIPSELDGHSVTCIGAAAFDYASLTAVEIPASVTAMDANPFTDCLWLTDIRVAPENKAYAVADGVLFDKRTNTLICYPGGFEAGSYAVPDGTAVIGGGAFAGNFMLTEVAIPATVTEIGDKAFADGALEAIELPASVERIGGRAFAGCAFTAVELPASVTEIGAEAFAGCYALESVTIPASVAKIGSGAFSYCTSLKKAALPAGGEGFDMEDIFFEAAKDIEISVAE